MKAINRILISKKVMQDRLHACYQMGLGGIYCGLTPQEHDSKLSLLAGFLEKINVSENPFNKVFLDELIARRGIIRQSYWISYEAFEKEVGVKLHPVRANVSSDYGKVLHQMALIIISGIVKENALILDKKARIMDGYQRLEACRVLKMPFYSLMINYQDPEGG